MEQLRKTSLSKLSRKGERYQAGEWVHQMGKRLYTFPVQDKRRMMLVSYYMRGIAFDWWDS